jgi:hypothetical protein
MAQDISDDVKQWTAKRRRDLVLQLLRGETTVTEAAQKHAFTNQVIQEWLDKALTAMQNALAQFIGLCSSLKWSSHLTNSPFLALPATAGSNAAYKIISACSNAVS